MPPSAVEQVREALETHGAPGYLQANLDDVDLSFHDSSASLGHDVEIHADVEGLQVFFTMIREAAEDWDGSDPIRPAVS